MQQVWLAMLPRFRHRLEKHHGGHGDVEIGGLPHAGRTSQGKRSRRTSGARKPCITPEKYGQREANNEEVGTTSHFVCRQQQTGCVLNDEEAKRVKVPKPDQMNTANTRFGRLRTVAWSIGSLSKLSIAGT